MKVVLNPAFCGTKEIKYHDTKYNITEIYNDKDYLTSRIKYDKAGRDIDAQHFDEQGNIISHQHKKYIDNMCIETFKNQHQQYKRTTKSIIKDGFNHFIEEFVSFTSPDKNYIHEFIRDMSGKLVKIISNGKIINLT